MGVDERGQMFPLLASLMLLGGGAMSLLATVAGEMNEATQAQTAADAAALAAVTGGQRAAHQVAEANGASVISLRIVGSEAQVTVGVDGHEAVAQAKAGRGLTDGR